LIDNARRRWQNTNTENKPPNTQGYRMFTLQIQCTTIEDAERVLAALKHTAEPAVVQQVAEQIKPPAEAPKKRGRPRREVAATATEKPAASPASLSESQGSTAAPRSEPEVKGPETQQAPTFEDVRNALKAVQAKYGENDLAKPLAILAQFDAARVSAVKESDYPAFIAACEAA
jgi:hypothetical protein